jgi:transitional endoplasmic reticulum ATPase
MDHKKQLQAIYTEALRHCISARLGVDHAKAFQTILAHHYPSHAIVQLDAYAPDSFEAFTSVTEGTSIQLDLSDGHVIRVRDYEYPKDGRVRMGTGRAREEVRFGRYDFVWDGKDYVLYKFSYNDKNERSREVWHILYPLALTTLTAKGDCPEIDALIIALGSWAAMPHEDIQVFEQGYMYRSHSLYESIKNATWDDVVMEQGLKTQIQKDVVSFFSQDTKDMYLKYQIPYKRGLLLHGPPGNGKTSIIKAVIAHLLRLEQPVQTLYVKSLVNKCAGDHVSVKEVFKSARRMAPCCMILEDLDSLVNDSKVRSYFLNEMDGLESNDGLLIIGSTNHLDNIDEAIRSRPSRFDRKYAFELPAKPEREAYARFWFDKLKDNEDLDFVPEVCPLIAELTQDFSYAFMKELFVATLWMAAKKGMGEEIDWDVVDEKSAVSSVKGEEKEEAEKKEEGEVEKKAGKEEVAEAGEKSSEAKADETVKDGEEKCTCCVKHKQSTKKGAKKTGKKHVKAKEEPKKKREVPQIEVPETLKENLFLKCAQVNVALLLRDMNSQDDGQKKEKKEKKETADEDEEDEEECGDDCSH